MKQLKFGCLSGIVIISMVLLIVTNKLTAQITQRVVNNQTQSWISINST